MAINLATKYSDQIAEVFTRASFIKGKTADTFDLTGVKTLKVYTPITVEEVDYDRDGGLARYGTVTEMQDVVQELTMTQDKAFTLTIDKGNNLDQNLVKNAADMLRLQLNEKSTPAADKYAFRRFVTMAGNIVESSAKPTKSDIITKIAAASQALDDALVAEHDVAGDVGAAVVLCRYPDVAGVLAAGVVVLGPLAPLDVLPDVLFADGVLVERHLRVIFAEPDDVLDIVREGAALCLRHRVDDGVDVVIAGGGGGGDDVEEVVHDVAHGVVFRAHQGEEAAAAGEAGVFCFQERRRFFIAGVGYHGLHQRMLSNLALAMLQ